MIAYDENGRARLPVHLVQPDGEPQAGHWPTRCNRWAPVKQMLGLAHPDCPPCLPCIQAQAEGSYR